MRRLTPRLREKLKSPLGLLIQGSFDQTMKKLAKLVEDERPSRIISVGDVVSDSMVRYGILPHVLILDNKVMREPITPISVDADHTLRVRNPAGTLTDETWVVVGEATRRIQRTKVLVDGEEDLLTLVAVLCAPESSFVVYGQPREGIVVVRVTRQKKETVRRLVEAMETVASKS